MIQDVKCDQCGRPATILRCTPIYKPPDGVFAEEQFRPAVTEISCKICCPICGQRIQEMESLSS